MLLVPGLCYYGFTYDNWGANPSSTTPGTQITPGASNVEGSWTQVASSSNIAQDCYWMQLNISNGTSSTNQKDHLVDIGVDPAGGTSYSAVILNIVCGESNSFTNNCRSFLFPIFIKSGSSVAVRAQGNNAMAGALRAPCKFWGQPSNPQAVPVGMISETIGTITNSGGVSFTPGNAADGTWVSLGTTTNFLWWWQLCYELSSASYGGEGCYIDLAYGDATNKHVIMRLFVITGTTEVSSDMCHQTLSFPSCYRPVPAGSTMYVRGRSGSASTSGWNAVAIGVG